MKQGPSARAILGFALAASITSVVACSSTPSRSFDDEEDDAENPSGVARGSRADGGAGGGSSPGFIPGAVESDAGSANAACATSAAAVERQPLALAFAFDRSGSMKFNPSPNPKWDSCVAGLTTVFKDAASAGVSASLQVFPQGAECSTGSYSTPLVPMTALPDAQGVLRAALDANGPQDNFGTPTLPALTGVAQYADTLARTKPDTKVAVVLVTDGEPNNCNSTIQAVSAAAAASNAKKIPVYVVGVGNVANLNSIAVAGGTKQAFIVPVNDPNQIATQFQSAIAQIRTQALSCDYKLPPPPDGKQLDTSSVNVIYTPNGGAAKTLAFSSDCAAPGWRYDNPSNPTKVTLCPATCDSLKSVEGGKLEVVFGCKTITAETR